MNLSDELKIINKRSLDRIMSAVAKNDRRSVDSDRTVRRIKEIIEQTKDQRARAVERAGKHTYDIGEAIREADRDETWG